MKTIIKYIIGCLGLITLIISAVVIQNNSEAKQARLLKRMAEKTVRIEGERGFCSGFFIKPTLLVTAAHCVGGITSVTELRIFNSKNILIAKGEQIVPIVGIGDVVLIQTTGKYRAVAKVKPVRNPFGLVKNPHTVCGYPLNSKKPICYPLNYEGTHRFFFKFTPGVFPGHSGGPVFNSDGDVVGLITGIDISFSLVSPLFSLEEIK